MAEVGPKGVSLVGELLTQEPIYYVSILAQFLTYASFLSGAKICQRIHRQRSCAKLSPIPFLAGLNCSALWLSYGLLANESEIVIVNFIGCAFSLVYLAFFIVYTKHKSRLFKQLLTMIALLGAFMWIVRRSDQKIFLNGSLASMSSLIACAAPLATIQDVLRTKCVASMPFPIIASSLLVSLSWLVFGFMKGDTFIVFTNVIAVSISAAQLSLFAIYPSTHPYEKLTPSNKKSYDLIRLLSSFEDEEENEEDEDEREDEDDDEEDKEERIYADEAADRGEGPDAPLRPKNVAGRKTKAATEAGNWRRLDWVAATLGWVSSKVTSRTHSTTLAAKGGSLQPEIANAATDAGRPARKPGVNNNSSRPRPDYDQIDTSQNYKETLARIMNQIYLKGELQSKKTAPVSASSSPTTDALPSGAILMLLGTIR